jgi:hypothetical protein
VKDLYASALRGERVNVVGVDIPFTPPRAPDLVVDNRRDGIDHAATARDIDRQAALDALGRPVDAAPDPTRATEPGEHGLVTAELLELLYAAHQRGSDDEVRRVRPWLELLVQRFEVTKRVHNAYGPDRRAVNKEEYRDLGLYVRFAEVLEAAYRRTGMLPCLNALLKCLDTLCAGRRELPAACGARVARLVLAERELVAELAGRVEVAW